MLDDGRDNPNRWPAAVARVQSWFGVSGPVGRAEYVAVGIGLAVLKYLVEIVFVYQLTGQFHSPTDFINPWLNSKAPFLNDAPGIGLAWLAFTIPFVWIGIAMSLRRAADVGISPWVAMLILIPLVNLLVMLTLSVLPSGLIPMPSGAAGNPADQIDEAEMADAYRPTPGTVTESVSHRAAAGFVTAVLVGCLTQVLVGAISVWVFEVYGVILFFSSPVIAGSVSGFVYSGSIRRRGLKLFGMTCLMNLISFIAMLCLGLDGAICLLMAFPLLFPLSFIGALVGAAIATSALRGPVDESRGMVGWMIALPLFLLLEPFDSQVTTHSVTTTITVDAPPDVVWEQVVAFPEITQPLPWYFRIGIAAPMRARIDGRGVGATRYCEFTTGAFVEPITHWDQPSHLAFDVASQPEPMFEWTPFDALHPPHLDSGLVSRRGEFRLVELPDGKTRLSGTTWYELNVRPRLYWKIWADPMLHRIHRRVLDHIAVHCETDSK